MLMKLFGVLDLLSASSIIMLKLGFGESIAWFSAIYLIIKAIPFIKDPASIVDIVAAILIIAAIFGFINIVSYIAVAWLLQKAIFSFI